MTWSKSDYERLGDYVTSARLRAGMDRMDLAEGADISLRTLSDIENGDLGKRKAFSSETLEAIGLCIGWKPGSWRSVLNGGEPALVSDFVPHEAEREPFDEAADDVVDILPSFDRMNSAERRLVLLLAEALSDRDLLQEAREPRTGQRPDFVLGDLDGPTIIFELKSGQLDLNDKRAIEQLRAISSALLRESGASEVSLSYLSDGKLLAVETSGASRIKVDPNDPAAAVEQWLSEATSRTGDLVAADEQETSISGEQEESETP